jgi:hypothetical protein
MTNPGASLPHVWKFHRIGGLDQVAIDTAADLAGLQELDPKLWVALSCPVKGLELDERTLALIDTDGDGRIRVSELKAAIAWLTPRLVDPGLVLKPGDTLDLAQLNQATAEGKALHAAARRILAGLGKAGATSISVEEAGKGAQALSGDSRDGDGVLAPGAIAEASLGAVVSDLVACVGGVADRAGKPGVNAATLEAFFKELSAYVAWVDAGQAPSVLVLGAGTAAAAAAVQAIRAKVEDYFARCRLAAFDPRSAAVMNRSEADYGPLAAKELSAGGTECAGLPLSRVAAFASLTLTGPVNPAWSSALAALRDAAVLPLLGGTTDQLSEGDWERVSAALAPYSAWQASKAGASVEKLGVERARALLASDAKTRLSALLAEDLAAAAEYEAVTSVERLLRYRRDLGSLLRNFVNFFDFYSLDRLAVFQAGTLFLDSRSTELCIRVENAGAHAMTAMMSKVYLAYCDCRRAGGQTMSIAAAFTLGDSDYLFPGRNGVFYDRKGQEWDATITKVVDSPIGIGQAFWSPYKRVIRFVEEQVAKRASEADSAANAQLQGAATAAGTAATSGGAALPPKPKFEVGTVAALGVAVGGITAAMGGLLQAFFGLGLWMPLGVLGLVLLISGPSMLIAWMKLRQRNLGPLLEANGWAINGRVKINLLLGSTLTEKAVLPASAQRSLVDPYQDEAGRKARAWIYASVFVLLAVALGVARYLHTWPFGK